MAQPSARQADSVIMVTYCARVYADCSHDSRPEPGFLTGEGAHSMVEFADGATLHTYLAVIRRRKWWLIALAFLGLAASLGLSLTEPKEYSATAQLLVQAYRQSLTLGSAAQQVTTTDVQTELQLATSAPVLHAVQRKLGSAPPIQANEVAQTN